MKLVIKMKVIAAILLLLILPQLNAAEQKPIPMVILLEAGEFDNIDEQTPHLLSNVWQTIREYTPTPLQPKQLQVSMSRSWKELPKQQNACIMNALKSDDREQVAYFSRYPLSVYPPIRLFHRRDTQISFSRPFDFAQLEQHPEITLGVVKGRSYGADLDKQLAAHQLNVYQRSSIESSTKLIEMLLANRVDAILDYSLSIDHYFNVLQLENPLVAEPIADVTQPMFGYIACSKTAQGKAIIDNIDASLTVEHVQQQYIDYHRQFFGEMEFALLQPLLEQLFQSQ
ncbi:hypothetical protein [Shewanella waksmanii]|uniref:hypothetical protein n=1 Tax=Shewanella waksmanii TaxID=213783 RepID=UPI003735F43D